MQHRQITQTVKQILSLIEATGGKAPKPTETAFQKFSAIVEKAGGNLNQSSDISKAVIDALEAGADPATDPGVQAAVTRRTISEYGLDQELNLRSLTLIEAHAPALVEAMRPAFETAAATLEEAYGVLGDTDLTDTAAVLSHGGDAARVWADAQDAERVITQVHRCYDSLALATRSVNYSPQYRLLSLADVPATTWLDDNLLNSTMTGWQIVQRGWTLSLASPDAIRDRIEAIQHERERRSNLPASEFKAEMRRKNPPIVVGAR